MRTTPQACVPSFMMSSPPPCLLQVRTVPLSMLPSVEYVCKEGLVSHAWLGFACKVGGAGGESCMAGVCFQGGGGRVLSHAWLGGGRVVCHAWLGSGVCGVVVSHAWLGFECSHVGKEEEGGGGSHAPHDESCWQPGEGGPCIYM